VEHFFMKDDLRLVVDGHLHVSTSCVEARGSDGVKALVHNVAFISLQRGHFVVAHDDLVSVSVDVTLHERNGFSEDVEACSDHINVHDLVVSYHAKASFIKIARFWRCKRDYNTSKREWLHHTLGFGE
jgi:hypothetical protein